MSHIMFKYVDES